MGTMNRPSIKVVGILKGVIPMFQHMIMSSKKVAKRYPDHYFHHSLRRSLQEHKNNMGRLTKSTPTLGSVIC
jgi:hypothetical protein